MVSICVSIGEPSVGNRMMLSWTTNPRVPPAWSSLSGTRWCWDAWPVCGNARHQCLALSVSNEGTQLSGRDGSCRCGCIAKIYRCSCYRYWCPSSLGLYKDSAAGLEGFPHAGCLNLYRDWYREHKVFSKIWIISLCIDWALGFASLAFLAEGGSVVEETSSGTTSSLWAGSTVDLASDPSVGLFSGEVF